MATTQIGTLPNKRVAAQNPSHAPAFALTFARTKAFPEPPPVQRAFNPYKLPVVPKRPKAGASKARSISTKDSNKRPDTSAGIAAFSAFLRAREEQQAASATKVVLHDQYRQVAGLYASHIPRPHTRGSPTRRRSPDNSAERRPRTANADITIRSTATAAPKQVPPMHAAFQERLAALRAHVERELDDVQRDYGKSSEPVSPTAAATDPLADSDDRVFYEAPQPIPRPERRGSKHPNSLFQSPDRSAAVVAHRQAVLSGKRMIAPPPPDSSGDERTPRSTDSSRMHFGALLAQMKAEVMARLHSPQDNTTPRGGESRSYPSPAASRPATVGVGTRSSIARPGPNTSIQRIRTGGSPPRSSPPRKSSSGKKKRRARFSNSRENSISELTLSDEEGPVSDTAQVDDETVNASSPPATKQRTPSSRGSTRFALPDDNKPISPVASAPEAANPAKGSPYSVSGTVASPRRAMSVVSPRRSPRDRTTPRRSEPNTGAVTGAPASEEAPPGPPKRVYSLRRESELGEAALEYARKLQAEQAEQAEVARRRKLVRRMSQMSVSGRNSISGATGETAPAPTEPAQMPSSVTTATTQVAASEASAVPQSASSKPPKPISPVPTAAATDAVTTVPSAGPAPVATAEPELNKAISTAKRPEPLELKPALSTSASLSTRTQSPRKQVSIQEPKERVATPSSPAEHFQTPPAPLEHQPSLDVKAKPPTPTTTAAAPPMALEKTPSVAQQTTAATRLQSVSVISESHVPAPKEVTPAAPVSTASVHKPTAGITAAPLASVASSAKPRASAGVSDSAISPEKAETKPLGEMLRKQSVVQTSVLKSVSITKSGSLSNRRPSTSGSIATTEPSPRQQAAIAAAQAIVSSAGQRPLTAVDTGRTESKLTGARRSSRTAVTAAMSGLGDTAPPPRSRQAAATSGLGDTEPPARRQQLQQQAPQQLPALDKALVNSEPAAPIRRRSIALAKTDIDSDDDQFSEEFNPGELSDDDIPVLPRDSPVAAR
eukprot:TRINITY_DN2226_c0_g5_i1.p1 TRINITY_DN2226_c0_g5~~TRINITY_DN2226_c0_g5_i1.p1  ORF type:complete len:1007 (+),score=244.31 TRINITY_DN2226_c0_g5_i1:123-3143(+)